jgi:hypothetical protein
VLTRWGVLLAVALASLGCGGGETPDQPGTAPADPAVTNHDTTPPEQNDSATGPPAASPAEILAAVRGSYIKTRAYRDNGVLRATDPDGKETETPLALAFDRTGKLDLAAYQARLVIGEKLITGHTEDLPHQWLFRPRTADPMTLDAVNAISPDVLTPRLQGELEFSHPALALLIGEDPIDALVASCGSLATNIPQTDGRILAGEWTLLEPAELEGKSYQRVQCLLSDRPLVLWVDPSNHIIRRIDLPRPPGLTLVADFRDATFMPDPAPTFEPLVSDPPPEGTYLLAGLQPIPPPPAPPSWLGEAFPTMTLETLDGEAVEQTWGGKVNVVEFWSAASSNSVSQLRRLAEIAKGYANNTNVQFVAVNIDPLAPADQPNLGTSIEQIRAAIPNLDGVPMTVLHDPKSANFTALDVNIIPLTVIVDASGKAQWSQSGPDAEINVRLPEMIDAVRAGRQLHRDLVRAHDEQLNRYREYLLSVSIPATSGTPRTASTGLPEAKMPTAFQVAPAWSSQSVAAPGNMAAVPGESPEDTRLFVLEGTVSLAELSASGEFVGRRNLSEAPDAVFTFLRVSKGEGQPTRIAAAGLGETRVTILDPAGETILNFPPEGEGARVADLRFWPQADGEPLFVLGHYNGAGVHAISMAGERRWVYSRDLEFALNICVLPEKEGQAERILATTERGTILALDAAGERVREILVGRTAVEPQGRNIGAVYAEDLNGDGTVELVGMGLLAGGRTVAVGFDLSGRELWNYELPSGLHQWPIDPVVVGQVPGHGGRVWMIAGADGGIHVLAADGKRIDVFQTGTRLAGLAFLNASTGPMLVATQVPAGAETDPNRWSVTAWHLLAPGEAAPMLPAPNPTPAPMPMPPVPAPAEEPAETGPLLFPTP